MLDVATVLHVNIYRIFNILSFTFAHLYVYQNISAEFWYFVPSVVNAARLFLRIRTSHISLL